ncbi:hypothetical protein NECAME_06686 [Necator americanus]|uniref:Uncharacterized protein n=1 Tax=Necator americanus TaxID=51031 RepID=W2TUU4_NECAM|nr:hypothetical protein NECAME_06686 [Necator americanus]ETN84802.1 hypothetical protein NECAME_06686 [Necator americanus]
MVRRQSRRCRSQIAYLGMVGCSGQSGSDDRDEVWRRRNPDNGLQVRNHDDDDMICTKRPIDLLIRCATVAERKNKSVNSIIVESFIVKATANWIAAVRQRCVAEKKIPLSSIIRQQADPTRTGVHRDDPA